jgi:hypothetical protein
MLQATQGVAGGSPADRPGSPGKCRQFIRILSHAALSEKICSSIKKGSSIALRGRKPAA